ncbi:methyltransferase domain-containing protein (plasmid) [Azospirillum sp. HJ39]|uniref:class I SAM-dependent methyltransferase n=1 Tax=Azospirillum sp. HJ39 TaxID=3159496 RepID=UPI0035584A1B
MRMMRCTGQCSARGWKFPEAWTAAISGFAEPVKILREQARAINFPQRKLDRAMNLSSENPSSENPGTGKSEIPGLEIPRNWTFQKAGIAAAFDRHVREQLPWYDLATGAIAHIARHYIPTGGLVYDIGASTGNVGRALAETLKDRRARLVAIESAAEMIARYDGPGEVIQTDALAYDYERFDLGVCFLLLMFLPVSRRAAFVDRLRERIKPGGALIVFDKCEAEAGYPATVLWRLTLAGKVSAGVDPAEIVAKELSLCGVQRPISQDVIGRDAVEWFRFGEFAGWLIEG